MANTKKYVSLDKLSLYDDKIKKVITDGDAASLQSAKDYAKSYADGLAVNYDVAGAAATVQGELDKEVLRAKAAEEANAAAAKKAQDEVDALELVVEDKADAIALEGLRTYVGTIPTGEDGQAVAESVIKYIDKKTEGIATDAALGELQGKVAEIESDHLKAADKTELEGKITNAQDAADAAQLAVDQLSGAHTADKTELEGKIALKADITALNEVSAVANAAVKQSDYDVKVKALEDEDARIVGLVDAEALRAQGVEDGLKGRIETMEAFWSAAKADGDEGNVIDTLKEIQEYIAGDETGASEMLASIQANAKAIEDHGKIDHDFAAADEALKSELNGEIAKKADKTTVEGIDGRVGTLEGEMDTVEGKVSTLEGKVAGLETESAKHALKTEVEASIEALEGVDTALTGRIAALEGKFGEGDNTVEQLIATAKQEAIDAAALDAASKAGAAETAAKGHADSLNTAMNTRVEALEAIDHEHTNKAELDLIVAGDKAKWDAAAAIAHEHANSAVLEGITAGKVAAWDAAEGNAKTYADGLNTAMDTRVVALETWHTSFTECSEEDINNLFA